MEGPEQAEQPPRQKKAEKLESEAWLDFTSFIIWRSNFRSEVSSCASRPIEAVIWINETESAKSIAYLKTSYPSTGAKLQANFEVVVDSKVASGLKKIIQKDFKKRVFIQEEAAQRKTLPHGKASRMDGI